MIRFLKKYSYLLITTIAFVILIGSSYQVMLYLISLKKEPRRMPQTIITRSVLAQKVQYEKIISPVAGTGRVVSTQQIVVSSEVRGKILEGTIPFKKGQQFGKGEVLIRIFDGNAVTDLKSLKSSFLQRIAGILPDLKVDYPDSYTRWMDFFKAIDLDEQLPELPEVSTDQEKIFVASRNILSDYYSIKSDEITLDKYIIHAPFNGTFIDVFMEVGAIANPGATLARIIRTDRLEVEVPIETVDVGWIAIGDTAHVSTEDGLSSWTGRVVRKSDFVNENTQTRNVFVRLGQSKNTPVYMGQYLKAVFNGKVIEKAMEIPRNAVYNNNVVFVVVDGKLAKREINILKINETTLIFSCLGENTEIVVEPLINAVENTEVQIAR